MFRDVPVVRARPAALPFGFTHLSYVCDGSSGSGDSKILRASAPFVGHVFSLLFNCCRPDPKILPSAQSLQLIQVLQSCENNLF